MPRTSTALTFAGLGVNNVNLILLGVAWIRMARNASKRHISRSTRKQYLVETALRADFALINAFLADYLGNLSYALTGRNFNPIIAMAADTTIVCADHIVPVGLIAPDHVVTPAPLVDYLIMNG